MVKFEWNKVHNLDCLKGLRKIKESSVDLIITSPPYNIGNFNINGNDLGTYAGNNMTEGDYQDWQLELLAECFRVLKPSGSLFYNHKVRIKEGAAIHPLSWLLETDFTLKQEITWNQKRGANVSKIRFFPFSERIYWLTKSADVRLFNANNLTDVWDVTRRSTRSESGHLAVMPEGIVENILDSVDCVNVLDPFAGSGTTLKVAKRYGKAYMGFEICPDYCALIRRGLAEVN